MGNPWLNIPAADYEAHMGCPDVDQLSFLGSTFKKAMENNDCDKVAILGCATGNGIEYINKASTRKVTVVDINPEYLEILRQRYEQSIPGLEIVEADLELCSIGDQEYSLAFAGLIFEYLNPRILLAKTAKWLSKNGVLVAVLQLPAKHLNKISATPNASLRQLDSIMKLISPRDFKKMAGDVGLREIEARTVMLKSGKSFYVGSFTNLKAGLLQ